MVSGVTVTKDGMAKLKADILAFQAKRVMVGITSDSAEREATPDEPHPINNAAIGFIMEHGSPAQNIPARPFLAPGVQSVMSRIVSAYKAGGKKVLDGQGADIDQTHMKVGLIAQSGVQEKITDGPFTPLSPATLAARQAKGRTGDKPLLDTGSLRQSITYAIREKGK